jgi:lysophospholipase L1-like esterase
MTLIFFPTGLGPAESASEGCNDGIDNDLDGLIDCADTSCSDDPVCELTPIESECDDSIDNDGDTLIDCDDSDCDAFGPCGGSSTLFSSDFITDSQGFIYNDDVFNGTLNPSYASGAYSPAEGFTNGAILVEMGGVDQLNITSGMSGGWSRLFNVFDDGDITINLRYRLVHAGNFEPDECSEALVAVDGVLLSNSGAVDYLEQLCGFGDGSADQDTGWNQTTVTVFLTAGTHTITVGGYLNQKTFTDEAATVYFDDIDITSQTATTETICDDGIDNDLDGFTDCDDSDCALDPVCLGPETLCADGIDNDLDGFTDCDDSDCAVDPVCVPGTETVCDDGIDNDLDGFTDCNDSDCDLDPACSGSTSLLSAGFDSSSDGFVYADDAFRTTSSPVYANGTYDGSGGFTGGGLRVILGGIDGVDIFSGMSGGWSQSFTVPSDSDVSINLRYRLVHAGNFEPDECSEALVAVDGVLLSNSGAVDYLEQLCGFGDGSADQDTGWNQTTVTVFLTAGTHTITVGGYLNQKTFTDEAATVYFDDIDITSQTATTETICDDGIDNDLDGFTDCDDSDCALDPVCLGPETLCADGIDNDLDGFTDCDDSDCALDPVCAPGTETVCDDGIDNDLDGFTDCNDSDCDLDPACSGSTSLLSAGFDSSSDGFVYADDAFRTTSSPVYANGTYDGSGGFTGGGLRVILGGIDGVDIFSGMSGGWSQSFTVPSDSDVSINLRYRLVHAGNFEPDECSEALVAVDGVLLSNSGAVDYLEQLCGFGDGSADQDTGWNQTTVTVFLTAGTHTITVGGYLNQKTFTDEAATVYFDDIDITSQTATTETICDDGIDNDLDGFTDCDDSDCALDPVCLGPETLCADGIDNDLDGFTDCDDSDCALDPVCAPGTETVCDDGIDNDLDGFTDCNDSDCDLDPACSGSTSLLSAGFDSSSDGFVYADDAFRTTSSPVYANGTYDGSGGFTGGGLRVILGGIDGVDIFSGMSGGWSQSFTVPSDSDVSINLRYRLVHAGNFEPDECSEALVAVDGVLLSNSGAVDYLEQLCGFGDGSADQDTGWNQTTVTVFLTAGTHTITVGGYLNQKTFTDEAATVYFDDIDITSQTATTETICDDGIDNDLDGFTDCDDSDCALDPVCLGPETLCADGIDNDLDGFTDCDDSDCALDPVCAPGTETVCDDGIDNDLDGFTDCNDSDCDLDPACSGSTSLLSAGFDSSSDGFVYADDAFRTTSSPVYANGTYDGSGGFTGGGLRVILGGIDGVDIFSGMSGGWSQSFTVPSDSDVSINLRYRLVHAGNFEPDECSEALVAVDGVLLSNSGAVDYLEQLCGFGDGSADQDTGWNQTTVTVFLTAGTHTITVGGYLNQKTFTDEAATVYFDDIDITSQTATTETICDDGIDNDLDGFTDCDDSDCALDPVCLGPETLCADGIDNDLDGFTDCDDSDCALDPVCAPGTETVCDDGIDNDLDGFTDCNDSDCDLDPVCASDIETQCSDSIDDDNDGLIDCDDPDCSLDPACSGSPVLFSSGFDGSTDGFTFTDDTFRDTGNPLYANGNYDASGGFSGGGLHMALGGVDASNVTNGMSGGWSQVFNVITDDVITIKVRYRLVHGGDFEPDECAEVLMSVDAVLLNPGRFDFIDQRCGVGDGNPPQDTGWQQIEVPVALKAGAHTITLGGFLNQKTTASEATDIFFDTIVIAETNTGAFFIDDFQDGSANGWTTINDSGEISNWQVSDEHLVQLNNRVDAWELSYHIGSYRFVDNAAAFSRANYRASAKIRSLPLISGLRDDVGLMLRYTDNDNYVRVSISKMQGFVRLEKKVGGDFSTLAFTGRPPELGSTIDVTAHLIDDTIFVYVNHEPLFGVTDTDLGGGNALESGTIGVFTQGPAEFDNILIAPLDATPRVIISNPMAFSVETTGEQPGPYALDTAAVAANVPSGGGVRFILDSGTACDDYTPPYTTDTTPDCPAASGFDTVAVGDHDIEALIIDSAGNPLFDPAAADNDLNEEIGVGGVYIVMMGDSIYNGVGDDSDNGFALTQNNSTNGKNLNRGAAPILNDLLSDHLSSIGNPLPVAVYNEGLGGTTSIDGFNRLDSTTDRHTKSIWLILFGSNDSSLSINLPDGRTCSETDFLKNEPACIGTYKYYMREIILDLLSKQKTPRLAKVPYIQNANPNQLDLIGFYNIVIDQLTDEHLETAVQPDPDIIIPPDFYTYFLNNQNTELFDGLHPNGIGYSSIAQMLVCSMVTDLFPGPQPAFCSNF